jgi:hypothetical protein
MVVGLDTFRNFFQEYTDKYLIIGGTACDIIIERGGFEPRATDDIDLILIIGALSPEFVGRFWEFVAAGRYTIQQKDKVRRNCYRFRNPQSPDFPKQVELFCKTPDSIDLHSGAHLTPIPACEGLSNLSAILLDEDYYSYTIEHSIIDNNVHFANTEAIICLKAFAYLDNKLKREQGVRIRSGDVTKHKNDVFRMVFMLNPDDRFPLPEKLKNDLALFVNTVKDDLPHPEIFNINRFGRQNMQIIIERLIQNFNLNAG